VPHKVHAQHVPQDVLNAQQLQFAQLLYLDITLPQVYQQLALPHKVVNGVQQEDAQLAQLEHILSQQDLSHVIPPVLYFSLIMQV